MLACDDISRRSDWPVIVATIIVLLAQCLLAGPAVAAGDVDAVAAFYNHGGLFLYVVPWLYVLARYLGIISLRNWRLSLAMAPLMSTPGAVAVAYLSFSSLKQTYTYWTSYGEGVEYFVEAWGANRPPDPGTGPTFGDVLLAWCVLSTIAFLVDVFITACNEKRLAALPKPVSPGKQSPFESGA